MEFELSKYQQDILDYVKFNKGNLLIDAKAGSGKTSTLILVAEELIKSGQNCLFLSFNKSIVDELKLKLPQLSDSIKTVHSLGLTFIRSYAYKKYNTNYEIDLESGKKKTRELCRAYFEKYYLPEMAEYFKHEELSEQEIKEITNNIISDYVNVCNFIRLYCANYHDAKIVDYFIKKWSTILPEYIDEIPSYLDLVPAVIDKELQMFENPTPNPEGKIILSVNFLDMIFLPVAFNMNVPYSLKNSLDTVLVDECQDLSMLQQMFIRRLNTGYNRFIFVGDRSQSIYRL